MTPGETKPKNIFETASRIEQERNQEKKTSSSKTQAPKEDVALAEIFRRCHQMHKEITESLDRAFKQAGVTSGQLQKFVSKPRNFSSDDWNKVEEGKKQSEKMLTDLKSKIGAPQAPVEQKKPSEPPKSTPEEPPQQPQPAKKKPKIITRRQWIGM
jgi:hypothetical protein